MSFSLESSFRAALRSRCFNSGPSRIVIPCVLIRLSIIPTGASGQSSQKSLGTSKSFIQAKSSQTIVGPLVLSGKDRTERQEKSYKKFKKNVDRREREAVTFSSNECKR